VVTVRYSPWMPRLARRSCRVFALESKHPGLGWLGFKLLSSSGLGFRMSRQNTYFRLSHIAVKHRLLTEQRPDVGGLCGVRALLLAR
jgi:hypothetical protein